MQPTKIYEDNTDGKKVLKGWDVRTPAGNVIKREFETYKKYDRIIPLFLPSGMAREPIIEAFGEDLCNLLGGEPVEREMLLDWYDSHTYRPYLEITKTRLNMINTFYPAGCTDCLAAPDGGLIKVIQDGFKRAVNARLAENCDEIYASDFDS